MAWYKTGTVAVTNASTTVTGTGTNFVSGAQVGDGFLGPNELLYEITAINSATSLTIAPAYGGATASSQSYAIAPTQGLVATLASDVTDLITDYQSVVDNAGAGKFGDGSAASPAIRFTNDQDTGFFRDTANEIAFATAGVKRGEFSSSGIQLLDSQKFIAGTGSDLQIYSDGTKSYLIESGSGDLELRATDFVVKNAGNTKIMASFNDGGAVQLRYDNSVKLATTNTGVDVTGNATFADNGKAIFGAGSDLQIYHDGSNSFISDQGTGNLKILAGDFRIRNATDTDSYIFVNSGAEVGLTYNGSTKLATTSSGVDITGDLDASSSLKVNGTLLIDASMNLQNLNLVQVATGSSTAPSIRFTGDTNTGFARPASDTLGFITAGSEAMRLDASRNLLVGKTSSSLAADGIEAKANGSLFVTRSSATPVSFRRSTNDGSIVNFYKDSTTVGSIGNISTRLFIADANGVSGIKFYNGGIHACGTGGATKDNLHDLGGPTARWDDVYATNGTIQTSDRNEKQDIAELSDAEQRVAVAAKGLMRKFRWRDAVEAKGDEARTHFGIIAQDLQAAFTAEGLDAGDYAMFISSTWTDEETGEERTRMGVRYSELLAFIIAAI